MKSLFGDEIPDITQNEKNKQIREVFKKWKFENLYHRSRMDGICCKYCKEFLRTGSGNSTFFKCKIMGTSNSSASDIRANHVCRHFKQ